MRKQLAQPSAQSLPLTPKSSSRRSAKHKRQRGATLRGATRTRRLVTVGVIVAILISAAVSLYFVAQTQTHPQNQTKPGVNPAYSPIDGIACNQMEQAVFHIHAHLSLSIDGQAVIVPQGIGIAPDGSCLYWLHTHTNDGVIHIEAPQLRSFTLGNFLEIWRTQFASLGYPSELDLTKGWQVYVDGKLFSGDFRTISLQEHTLVTLAYHSPGIQPDTTFYWNGL